MRAQGYESFFLSKASRSIHSFACCACWQVFCLLCFCLPDSFNFIFLKLLQSSTVECVIKSTILLVATYFVVDWKLKPMTCLSSPWYDRWLGVNHQVHVSIYLDCHEPLLHQKPLTILREHAVSKLDLCEVSVCSQDLSQHGTSLWWQTLCGQVQGCMPLATCMLQTGQAKTGLSNASTGQEFFYYSSYGRRKCAIEIITVPVN